jgi:hypothetical protein
LEHRLLTDTSSQLLMRRTPGTTSPYEKADASLSGDSAHRAALARYLYEEVMFFAAGLVAEVKIAGYPAGYVEEDIAGRTGAGWDAIRAARVEAGLPICGHKDCEIPYDGERVTEVDVAAVIKRAEDEAFAMLKANWPLVKRVTNALCKRDRLTVAEFTALISSSDGVSSGRAGKRRRPKRSRPKPASFKRRRAIAGNGRLGIGGAS